ncbi:Hpt domain-containing protein, partial [Albidovulum sp.]
MEDRGPDPMARIRLGFLAECEELLDRLQDSLGALETAREAGLPPSLDRIHEAFRAAHTIKGGAGAFGLSAAVAIAHDLESALDAMRQAQGWPEDGAADLLLNLADRLADALAGAADPAPGQDAPPGPVDAAAPLARPGAAAAGWQLRFRPRAGFFASGNEPGRLLARLTELGAERIRCDSSGLPDLDRLDPERPCLAWQADLPAATDRDAIAEVFDFVADLCELAIEPRPAAA